MLLRTLHGLPVDVHRIGPGRPAGVRDHPGHVLVVPSLELVVRDHVTEVHPALHDRLGEPGGVVSSPDAHQSAVLIMRLETVYNMCQGLGQYPVAPVRLVASDLNVERRPVEPRAVMGYLEACLDPRVGVQFVDPPDGLGHRRRRCLHEGLGPAAEVRRMVVPYGMRRQCRASALRGVPGHDDHGVDPHAEALRLGIEVLVPDVHIRDAHHDVVPLGHVGCALRRPGILPSPHGEERLPHVHRRKVDLAAYDEPRHAIAMDHPV